MAGEIIRLGDSTTHGGKVLEGSPVDICMGKPIAYVGHKVQFPKCKGIFPIVEGAITTTFYGKGVALAGMHTACGALLIASQFTDIVEYGAGNSSAGNAAKTSFASSSPVVPPTRNDTSLLEDPDGAKFNDRFVLLDAETGAPISCIEYAIRRASGDIEFGTTDAEGHTHLLSATANAELIDIFV